MLKDICKLSNPRYFAVLNLSAKFIEGFKGTYFATRALQIVFNTNLTILWVVFLNLKGPV